MSFENLKAGEDTRVKEMQKGGEGNEKRRNIPANGEDVGNDIAKNEKSDTDKNRRELVQNFDKQRLDGQERLAKAMEKDPEGQPASKNPEAEKKVAAELEESMSLA